MCTGPSAEIVYGPNPYKKRETNYPYKARASVQECYDGGKNIKKYYFKLVGLESKERFKISLLYGFNMGCKLDIFCNEVLYNEYFFYKDNLMSLDFFNQPAYKIFESGIFTEEIPTIEHGPKSLYWKRALKCVRISLWSKTKSFFRRSPIGYQPLSTFSPDDSTVQI